MCDPVTITLGVISAVGTIYSIDQQKQNATRQERAYRKAQKVQEEQINAQKSVQSQQRAAQARAERARLRAASAESGLAGLSLDDLFNNVSFQEGTDLANIAQNNTHAVNASRAQLGSNLSGIQQPDYVGGLVSTGLQIYGIGQDAGYWGQNKPNNPGGG